MYFWTVLLAIAVAAVVLLSSEDEDTTPLPVIEPQIFGQPLESGTKVMVMLSGWPDSHEMWAKQVAAFRDDYHIVSLSTPDFDRSSLRRRWGYNFTEIPAMIRLSLDAAIGGERTIDALVTHDWGAQWGYYMLQSMSAGRVKKLVALDVSAAPPGDATPNAVEVISAILFAFPYQWFLATAFVVGTKVSPVVAQSMLDASWPMWKYIGPMDYEFDWSSEAPRPRADIAWWMGYPYYQLWFNYLGRGRFPPVALLPEGIPTQYMFGSRKRVMFHREDALNLWSNTDGCRVIAYEDCGHWMMHERPERLNEDMRDFLTGWHNAGWE